MAALTEDTPTIKIYYEDRWADYRLVPVETSLQFIHHLQASWVVLLRSLNPKQRARQFQHPELGRIGLDWNIGLYAWHRRHHLAHITNLAEREGWQRELK